MKFVDIKDMSATELKKKKKSVTHELIEAKMKNELGQLANPLVIRDLRKDLARIHTVITSNAAKSAKA